MVETVPFEWYIYPITIFVGIIVGFMNVVAGGGSILSLPLLMFLGLPPNVANGTNRIAILSLSVVGINNYRKQEPIDVKHNIRFIIPAVIGSIIGAYVTIDLNEELLRNIIGILLIFFFFIILYKPKHWLEGNKNLNKKHYWWQIPLFFIIGIYGGFIQMGAAFCLLGSFVLGAGYDLLRANVMKVFIVMVYTPFVLAIFIYHNQVEFLIGSILAIGTAVGAYIGSKMAIQNGVKFIRYTILAVILFSSAKLLGLFDWLFRYL